MNNLHLLFASVVLGLLAATAPAHADRYGTLFTTPEQRARLDAARNGVPAEPVAQRQGDGAAAKNDEVKLNGTLVSSAGRKEVWLNGESQMRGSGVNGSRVRVLTSERIQFQSSPGATPHYMKPGQVLDPGTGELRESYQQGKAKQVVQE